MPLDVAILESVGDTTDAASSTGNVLQRLAYIIAGLFQKPRAPVGAAGSFTTSQTTYQTALSISGKGKLLAMSVGVSGSYTPTVRIRLTVDGNVIAEGKANISSDTRYPLPSFLLINSASVVAWDTSANGGNAKNCEIGFKSSLKIEMLLESGSGDQAVKWQYEVE